jgi:hypothetical protein
MDLGCKISAGLYHGREKKTWCLKALWLSMVVVQHRRLQKIAKQCVGGCKTVSEAFYRKVGAENWVLVQI